MKPNREYRNINGFTADNEESMTLVGSPVIFNKPTCLYEYEGIKYYEVIDRHAFDGCDTSDFIFNYNHGGRVYARNRNGTLEYKITENAIECKMHLLPDDEGHQQLYRDIKTGLIDKMSFSFSVEEASYNSDTRTRTILKVKKLYDVSAVDIPAYNDTNISARSFFEAEHEKEQKALELEQRRKKAIAMTYLI